MIVDLTAEAGGNCELTEPDRVVVKHGVTIYGPTNLPTTMPVHAALDRPQATAVIEAVYKQMRPVNFSTAVCEQLPSRLRVFPVPDVGWSDWGSVERILATVRRSGKLDEVLARLRRRGSESVCTNAQQSCAETNTLHAPLNRGRFNTALSVDPDMAFGAARLSKGAKDEEQRGARSDH